MPTQEQRLPQRPSMRHFRAYERTLDPKLMKVVAIASLSGLCFGYSIGISAIITSMASFKAFFGRSPFGEAPADAVMLMLLLFLGGATVGSLCGGFLADRLGRKGVMQWTALLLSVSAVIGASAYVFEMLCASRVLCGIMIGILSTVTPLYLAEISPDHSRGKLTTAWQLAITTGIVLASAVEVIAAVTVIDQDDQSFSWRLVLLVDVFLGAMCWALAMAFLPESPYWLLFQNRRDEALSVLYMTRSRPEEVDVEVEEIEEYITAELNAGRAKFLCSWSDVLMGKQHDALPIIALGMVLQLFQQLTGINSFMFYQFYLFQAVFSTRVALYCTLGLNVVNQITTYATFVLIDRYGRVNLLVAGSAMMAASLALLSGLSVTVEEDDALNATDCVAIAACFLFVMSFALSWGPVVWTLTSEMYPVASRGMGMSLSTATSWAATALIGWLFPSCMDTTMCYTPFYASAAGLCLVGSIGVYVLLPETTGVPLWKMAGAFAEHKTNLVRHTSLNAMKNLIDRRSQFVERTAAAAHMRNGAGLEPQWLSMESAGPPARTI